MVHGMSQNHRVFSEQVCDFQDHYRILLIDLPGHGLSEKNTGPFGHRELAEEVLAAIDEAGVSRTHYWGTHTGTAIGIFLAIYHPQRIQSLILEGAVLPGRNMPSVTSELRRTQDIARTAGISEARRHWFNKSKWFDIIRQRPKECRAEMHWQIISEFPGEPWLNPGNPAPVSISDEELKALSHPVLIYNGEHDLSDFIEVAVQLKVLLQNIRREIVHEAGGFPSWEFPKRTNRLVAEFLARLDD